MLKLKPTESGSWLNKEVQKETFKEEEKMAFRMSSRGDWENDVVICIVWESAKVMNYQLTMFSVK